MDVSICREATSLNSGAPLESCEALSYARYRVLVADDQDSICGLIERVVQMRLGCVVLTAHDGHEVIEQLQKEPVDVLVTDMMMPGLHGFELLKQVRALRPDLDILVMTGFPEDFPYVEVVQTGAKDFINKPFPHAELEAKVLRLFKERELQREREKAESKYRSLFELSSDGMVLLEGEDYVIADANHAFCDLTGISAGSLKGRQISSIFEGADRLRIEQGLMICARRGGGTMADLILKHPTKREIHVDISASFIQAEFGRIVFLTFKDVTEKREVERQLAEAAEKDSLTGLFNKRSFQNRVAWAVTRARESHKPVSLMTIDLDNFKKCNDTHGHMVGDELLIAVGQVIRGSIRSAMTDEGFRCGGDEFSVILQETGIEGAIQVARRMQNEFAKIHSYGTTMSIGLASCAGDLSAEDLVRASDGALYKAKGKGKNAIETA